MQEALDVDKKQPTRLQINARADGIGQQLLAGELSATRPVSWASRARAA